MDIKGIAKLIGKEWGKLPKAKQAAYNKQWENANKGYKAKKKAYEAKWGKIKRKSKKFVEEKVDPNRPAPPKRPLNGFMRYSMEVKGQY